MMGLLLCLDVATPVHGKFRACLALLVVHDSSPAAWVILFESDHVEVESQLPDILVEILVHGRGGGAQDMGCLGNHGDLKAALIVGGHFACLSWEGRVFADLRC